MTSLLALTGIGVPRDPSSISLRNVTDHQGFFFLPFDPSQSDPIDYFHSFVNIDLYFLDHKQTFNHHSVLPHRFSSTMLTSDQAH